MGLSKLVALETLTKSIWEDGEEPCEKTIRDWSDKRIIPSVRLGRRVYFRVDDVLAALEARTKGGR